MSCSNFVRSELNLNLSQKCFFSITTLNFVNPIPANSQLKDLTDKKSSTLVRKMKKSQ